MHAHQSVYYIYDLLQATVTSSECEQVNTVELGQEFLDPKQVLDERLLKLVDHIG